MTFDLPPDLWNKGKTPLDRMYDRWNPRWEAKPAEVTYRIYAAADTEWRDVVVMANEPFPCHICGDMDSWENEGAVFVCDHGPVEYMETIRMISSVAARLVGRVEVAREL